MAPPTTRKRTAMTSSSPSSPTAAPSHMRQSFVEKGRWAAKAGGLPPPAPATIGETFTKVILHGCRKILFLNEKIRLLGYIFALFFLSLVADYMPFPNTYFSHKGNALNQYFVKYSWGWTFLFSLAFIYLTAATYTCGDKSRLRRHLMRLVIATGVWFGWVSVFTFIEESSAVCLTKDFTVISASRTKKLCLSKNGIWKSFDISGHSFLLIWCIFFMIEEAKAIVGWDSIKDHIRNEEHYRKKGPSASTSGTNNSNQPLGISAAGSGDGPVLTETVLSSLSEEEFQTLKDNYDKFSIPAKLALMGMTGLVLLWDWMILMTALYFHVMVEKVVGGMIGVASWVIVYRLIYKNVPYIGLPGQGAFKYSEISSVTAKSTSSKATSQQSFKPKASSGQKNATSNKSRSEDDVPKFMGMPLEALRGKRKDDNGDK